MKRDLLSEKEQLLLDLRHDFQLQVSKLTEENSLAVSTITKEKDELQDKATRLQDQVVSLTLELEKGQRSLLDASAESEKMQIELRGALNRGQIENESLKAELDSLRSRVDQMHNETDQTTQNSNEGYKLELNQIQEELDAATRALEDEKSLNTKLVKENEMLSNNQKPPLVPSSLTSENKSLLQCPDDANSKAADEFRDFLELAVERMSGVVDIPSLTPISPSLVLESLSLLVSHTLSQSSRISNLVSQIPQTLPDLAQQYSHLLQELKTTHKNEISCIVSALKKEYLGRYDAALARVLEDAKKHSQQRIGVLEREVLELREWRKQYFDANRVSSLNHGGQVEMMARSLQQRPSSYSVYNTNTPDHHQNQYQVLLI
jgi:hypothetical protein